MNENILKIIQEWEKESNADKMTLVKISNNSIIILTKKPCKMIGSEGKLLRKYEDEIKTINSDIKIKLIKRTKGWTKLWYPNNI